MVPFSTSDADGPADPDSPSPPAGSDGLQRRAAEELALRGYARRTRTAYLGHVRRFLRFIDTDPRHEPAGHARRYLLHLLHEREVSHSYANQAVSALKLFYRDVLEIEPPALKLPRPKVERKLPVVLGPDEVGRLLGGVRNPKHRAILMLVYAAGLRVGEVVRLKVGDIDSERMLVHVRQGKGRKDRYVMLSEIALQALRAYWKLDRPGKWLFPGGRVGRHLTERSVQKVFKRAARKAGIEKKVSVHSLRHAFATHLLEAGTDIRFIQKLLGHKSTKTTEIYTKVSKQSLQRIRSPLDRLGDGGLEDGDRRDGAAAGEAYTDDGRTGKAHARAEEKTEGPARISGRPSRRRERKAEKGSRKAGDTGRRREKKPDRGRHDRSAGGGPRLPNAGSGTGPGHPDWWRGG